MAASTCSCVRASLLSFRSTCSRDEHTRTHTQERHFQNQIQQIPAVPPAPAPPPANAGRERGKRGGFVEGWRSAPSLAEKPSADPLVTLAFKRLFLGKGERSAQYTRGFTWVCSGSPSCLSAGQLTPPPPSSAPQPSPVPAQIRRYQAAILLRSPLSSVTDTLVHSGAFFLSARR